MARTEPRWWWAAIIAWWRRPSYRIVYSPEAVDHLRNLSARDQATILDEAERKLSNEASVETRNRKPMRPNPVAPWELRVGTFRVYYEVTEEPEPAVFVLAIGIKDRDQVRIGGEVFKP